MSTLHDIQGLLTYVIEFVVWSFIVNVVLHFVLGLMARYERRQVSVVQSSPVANSQPDFVPNPDGFQEATPEESILVEVHQIYIQEYWRHYLNEAELHWEMTIDEITQDKTRRQAQPKKSTSEKLRQACQEKGIRWRNAHGSNRHLTKVEMLNALGLDQSSDQEVNVS